MRDRPSRALSPGRGASERCWALAVSPEQGLRRRADRKLISFSPPGTTGATRQKGPCRGPASRINSWRAMPAVPRLSGCSLRQKLEAIEVVPLGGADRPWREVFIEHFEVDV